MPADRTTDGSRRIVRDAFIGVGAAVRSAQWIESDLNAMLAWPEANHSRSFADGSAERPVRIAHRTLRLLARIPGRRWRNTCLFRSVAECAVRRECGIAARIVIGVDKMDGDVVAHSWVEQAGTSESDSRAMQPLHRAQRSALVL